MKYIGNNQIIIDDKIYTLDELPYLPADLTNKYLNNQINEI